MLSKNDLISRINKAYEALLAAIRTDHLHDPVEDVDQTDPQWSAKDVLAHITAWEQVLLEFHIGGRPFDEVIAMPGAEYHVTSFDEINAHLYGMYRDWSWEKTEQLAASVHNRLMIVLSNLPEETLQAPAESIAAIGLDPYPLYEYIVANTYDHYDEHQENVKRN